MVGSLDDNFFKELGEKFPIVKKGAEYLSLYFISSNAGTLFTVHVITKDYKKNIVSHSLDGLSAFALADKASDYLTKQGYLCSLDLKNLSGEVREKIFGKS